MASHKMSARGAARGKKAGENSETAAVVEDTDCSDTDAPMDFVVVQELKKGSVAMFRGQWPCKVVAVSKHKTGKHGHAKFSLVGLDLFTGKRHEDMHVAGTLVQCPVVKKTDYDLTGMRDDGSMKMAAAGGAAGGAAGSAGRAIREDLSLDPDGEMGAAIFKAHNEGRHITVTVLAAHGQEAVASFRAKK